MSWNTRYLPPDKTLWQGRADTPPASAFFQIVRCINLLDQTTIETRKQTFALVGFKCDEGIRRNFGRVGAIEGPNAIRQALSKLPIQKNTFECIDVGNIACADGDLEESQQALGDLVALLLRQKITPIVLGGGHELAWGHYQGIEKAYPEHPIGIINFDAHFDLRPLLSNERGSSGTPFLQIAEALKKQKRRFDYNCIGVQFGANSRYLLETAKNFHAHIIWADELQQGQLEKCVDFVDRIVDENEYIYASICLDVFASAFAPGVSAPQPLGLLPWQVIPLLRQLSLSGKMISYDIAELSPRYDIDNCTAKLAANLIYEIVHHQHDHLTIYDTKE